MIKLIASDMDGTLLNDDNMISEENLKDIRNGKTLYNCNRKRLWYC